MIPRAAGFCQQRQMAGDSGDAVFEALKEAGHHPRVLCPARVIQSEREAGTSSDTDSYRVLTPTEILVKTVFQEEVEPRREGSDAGSSKKQTRGPISISTGSKIITAHH